MRRIADAVVANGRKLAEYGAAITAEAIVKAISAASGR